MPVSWFPSPYAVVHIPRALSSTTVDPDTGNEILVAAPPVVRYVQEISQQGRSSSSDVLSGEFVDSVAETLTMSVDDPTVYSSNDQVIVDPEISDGDYVEGSGVAYWVDGNPNDQRGGPWAQLFDRFGGVIQLKRVT